MSVFGVRLINLCFRTVTLASKFLLVFFLAHFLEPGELGVYGLVTVTVSYLLFFLGFDFYVYTTREILKLDSSLRGNLLKTQIVFSLILYCLVMPASMALFFFDLLPWWILPWFVPLLILEHVTQELNRLLIALSLQLAASCVLFLRMGAWSLVVVFLMFVDERFRELETVFLGWIIGAFIALVVGFYIIARLDMGGWRKTINYRWIKNGLMVAVPMMLATLSIRSLFTLDRYWFEALSGIDMLGVYVFYIGICGAMLSFMDAGVFSFIYPVLISAYANENPILFRDKFRQLAFQTIFIVLFLSFCVWVLVGFLVDFLNHPSYMENLLLFAVLLIGNGIFIISMVPHYGLYARREDGVIILGHFLGLLIFLMSTAFFSCFFSKFAVPYGLVTAFTFILLWKSIHFYRLTPASWR